MAFYRRILQQLASSTNSPRFWLSTGIVSGLFASNLLFKGYRIASVQGESMQPTLNPKNSKFQDYVLIRDFDDFEVLKESCGSIVFALRKGYHGKDRRLVKRLTAIESCNSDVSGIKCWLKSDSQKEGFYDSKIFGYIPGSDVKGKVVAIIFPLHRITIFD